MRATTDFSDMGAASAHIKLKSLVLGDPQHTPQRGGTLRGNSARFARPGFCLEWCGVKRTEF